MFAMIQVAPTQWARFEFGRELDPPLTDEATLRRLVHDPAHRGDELWDVRVHLAWPILVRFLEEFRYQPGALQATLRCLGELAWDEPAPAVHAFATHEHPGVRAAAIEALGRLASFATMPAVANALVDPQPDVRRAAAIAAGKFGVPALVIAAAQAVRDEPALHGFVHEGVERTRAQVDAGSERVVRALIETSQWRDLHGWIGVHRRALLDLSRSARASDRARARMKGILMIHRVRKVGPEAAPYLADDSLDAETHLELIVGLGRSRVPHGIAPMLPFLRHDDERLQHAAVVALGRIGEPYPWRHLMAEWDARRGRLRDWIRVALRRITSVEGAPAVSEVLAQGGGFAPGSAVFLDDAGAVSEQLPVPWLEAQLASTEVGARRDAAALLGAFAGPDALASLRAYRAREADADVGATLDAGVARLQGAGAGAAARRFTPWPAVP